MEQDLSRYLSEARKQLAERRRLVIKSLASGYDREQMETHINMMMKIQNAIEVIDRVSQEERAARDDDVNRRVDSRVKEPLGSSQPCRPMRSA